MSIFHCRRSGFIRRWLLYHNNHIIWIYMPVYTMFDSSLPLVVCLIYVICVCLRRVVFNTLCCVFDLYFFILYTLCCQFLWIVHFLLPLRYSLKLICLVSCVPYVVSFSGLSIFDCPFGILWFYLHEAQEIHRVHGSLLKMRQVIADKPIPIFPLASIIIDKLWWLS